MSEVASNDVAATVLPKMAELNVTPRDIKDWSELPVTRLWFKGLVQLAYQIRNEALASYDRENADLTAARLAERAGAVRVLYDLLKSKDGDVTLFSEDDYMEATDGNG